AAEVITAVHRRASRLAGNPDYVVATVGRIDMTPNVPNAVPGRVDMVCEVRSDNPDVLDAFFEAILAETEDSLRDLRVEASMRELSRSDPTACAQSVMQVIGRAADTLGYANMV